MPPKIAFFLLMEKYIRIARIVGTHGVRGEIKLESEADSLDFIKKFKKFYIDNKPYDVEESREHKGRLLVKLSAVNDRESAEEFRNKAVYISREDAQLPKGRYFLQDILGAEVVDEKEGNIGRLVEFIDTPAGIIYVVKGERERLIPQNPEFIIETDAEKGLIKVRLIEGM